MLNLLSNPWAKIALVAAVFAAGAGSSWFVVSSIKDTEIASVKLTQADEKAKKAQASLDKFTEVANGINAQAIAAGTDISAVKTALANIRKDLKNAKPLPAGCKPDPVRVLNLDRAINATNNAISGH